MHIMDLRKGVIRFCSLLILFLGALAVPKLRAIAPVGDDAELFITGTVSGTYDDNIFLSNSNGTSDFIWDLAPGLSYEFGKTGSLTTGQLAVSEDFQEFTSHSDLDNQLFNGIFWTKYDDSKTSLDFDASYHQADAAERGIQNLNYLVKRDLAHVDGIGEVNITDKSSASLGIIWDDTDYLTNGFTDWRYWQIPVNYYWKIEPKLDLSAGFQYQDNTVGDNGFDSDVEYFNVGARGEFTPDLTGKFTIGYLREDLDAPGPTGGIKGGLGADGSFTYAVTPLSTITFGVNDDYGYAATGGEYRDLGAYLGASTTIVDQWSVNGQFAYNRYSYVTSPQVDDFYTARIGVAYSLSAQVTLQAYYMYAYDQSSLAAFTFKNNILSVSGTLHY